MMSKPSTRAERRAKSLETYLSGKSRGPYSLTRSINASISESLMEEDNVSENENTTLSNLCSKCRPVLTRYRDNFLAMKHTGSSLKKAKKWNPYPQKASAPHYRDLKSQNEWLRENMFDAMGNYLFCSKCIRSAFGVSKQRLSRQRSMKQKSSAEPTKKMTKSDVNQQKMCEHVVIPEGCDQPFRDWWKEKPDTDLVTVKYPYSRHGLAGKTSNSAMSSTLSDFLAFVDANSRPNGRSSNSYCPTHYFLPKFTTLHIPHKDVANYEQRVTTSLQGEFNRTQMEQNKPTISGHSVSSWLHKHRPKHAICPHKLDYCDKCSGLNKDINSADMTIKRLVQSGSSSQSDIKAAEDEKARLKASLDQHKHQAQASYKHYDEAQKKCKSMWLKIKALESEPNSETNAELATLKARFVLVICADYQQSKLIPYWGYSPQPGVTYYLQKLSCDVFGITDSRDDKGYIYLAPEMIGPKNSDHTISYLFDFLRSNAVPQWIKYIHLFMDNAGSTNKNYYLVAFIQEIIQQKLYDNFRLSFMIAGHTKFSVDRLFSHIAISYNRSDFSTWTNLSLSSVSMLRSALMKVMLYKNGEAL